MSLIGDLGFAYSGYNDYMDSNLYPMDIKFGMKVDAEPRKSKLTLLVKLINLICLRVVTLLYD